MSSVSNAWDREISRRTVIGTAGVFATTAGIMAQGKSVAQTPAVSSRESARSGSDWPVANGNPSRTGHAIDSGPEGEPVLLWRFEPGGSLSSASPVISGGVVYVTAGIMGEGSLVALELLSGEQLWTLPLGLQPFGSTPAIADGVIYLAGMEGEVAAIDLESRAIIWSVQLDAGTTSSPIVMDGLLHIGANDDCLHALDIADGSERWKFTAGEGADYTLGPSPAFALDAVFYANASEHADRGLFALDATSGDELWQAEPDTPGLFTPAIVDDVVYVAGNGGDVYALDRTSGEDVWRTSLSSVWSVPAVTKDAVLVQTMEGRLVSMDRETGDVQWEVDTPASWCSPVVAADKVYVGAGGLWFEMGLYAIDRSTGAAQWHMRTGNVLAPVAVSGNVLVVADDGAICAVGGSTGKELERGTNGNGAFLTEILFSSAVDDNSHPTGPINSLPESTTVLIASFDHVGLKYEAGWEAVWRLDGEPLATRTDTWQGESGRWTEMLSADQGTMPAGQYELDILLDGALIRQGQATIG